MQSDAHQDILQHKPALSKQIDKDEYFLLDQNTIWFFDIIKDGSFTLQKVIDEMKEMRRKSGRKVNEENIAKVAKYNIKEVLEAEIVIEKGDYEFDIFFYHIIQILKENPQSQGHILKMLNGELESRIAGLNDKNLDTMNELKAQLFTQENLEKYLHKLEIVGYIKKTWDLIREESTKRIIELISSKPMTIKDLESKYNEGLTKKNKKSENTIYRYLKTMELANIVMHAGKRVFDEKTATENLHTTTAHIYLTKDYDTHLWQSDFGLNVGKLISILLNIRYDGINTGSECYRDILYEISIKLDSKTKELIEYAEKKIGDSSDSIVSEFSFMEINASFRNAALIAWFYENPQLIHELLKCMSDSKIE